jgi:Holliday junction resolvase RusA-like endonuclease
MADNNYDLKFTVPGIAPSKKNTMILARGRMIKSADVRCYEALVQTQAILAMCETGLDPFPGPVAVQITCYYDDCRRRDVQNAPAAICDALNDVVYKDDSQIVHMIVEKYLCEKGQARTEICVWDLEWTSRYPLTKSA